ncbi:1-acyl-sn-glycerol-3-phosphate acyltransferase [Secundilactobacillus malefermentans]|uniref:1-acyl-sn-glycerol-3-phosphate acyltransferase n=1 Tax=Secundilactobacillus malefermentans TaxID=176292 RepID=UPI0011C87630|nr:1-acyl-sn-glycerol-3-phosphate acyltransferase [Secundilactobacillus malefermentans]QEA31518.1 1-acyl-sn-glycerol-3-phosphate acyltransferase [Secundilactobacillus malefermentans]
MRGKKAPKTYYYQSFTDDFVTSKNQDQKLPSAYSWSHNSWGFRWLSRFLYGLFWLFGVFYCKWGLHVTVKNRKVLKPYRHQGYFVYGNHTQPVGDVFTPLQVMAPKRTYMMAGMANLGIPVLGKLIPIAGALILPDSIHQMGQFNREIESLIQRNQAVTIYPEAHVWPYYTKIRPFPDGAFHYPVQTQAAAFAMTTTYQKRRWGSKPRLTVYVDGPFLPDQTLNKKDQRKKLNQEVHDCMVMRSKESHYETVHYQRGRDS